MKKVFEVLHGYLFYEIKHENNSLYYEEVSNLLQFKFKRKTISMVIEIRERKNSNVAFL